MYKSFVLPSLLLTVLFGLTSCIGNEQSDNQSDSQRTDTAAAGEQSNGGQSNDRQGNNDGQSSKTELENAALKLQPAKLPEQTEGLAIAIFAGGCFWCMEPPYDKLDGVIATTSGYTGGHVEHPTYRQVTDTDTGHFEAVRILYDPAKISYQQLLDVFWRNIDPFDGRGQFCDKGDSYRSAIFYQNDEEKKLAEQSKQVVAGRFGDEQIETEIRAAETFYAAENYHQDYYRKNPLRYTYYRFACRRDDRLEELWGPPADNAPAKTNTTG
jgi:peptide-methionine (S)-S-oxide reductase